MSDIAIQACNLSKRYHLGARPEGDIRDVIAVAARKLVKRLRRSNGGHEDEVDENEFWALKDVSFEVHRGQVLGIIGANGAGKSTLLKVLTRITDPTEGNAKLYGRVGSLLEVGTGFHPELTGHENIYLNGTILGMTKAEISRKYDEIVDFSGIEPFLATPVKRYSSGMRVRLGFAVAAHLEPEILIIDEVLAVGDAAFQEKCLGKMQDIAGAGRTVLFVSHNMNAVQGLCHRAIWLEHGSVRSSGDSRDVVTEYLAETLGSDQILEQVWEDPASAPGDEFVRIHRVALYAEHDDPSAPLTIRTPLRLEFEFWNLKPNSQLYLRFALHNAADIQVFNSTPVSDPNWYGRKLPVGLFRSVCHIPGDLLNDGRHRIHLSVSRDLRINYRMKNVLVFSLLDDADRRGGWYKKWSGVIRPNLHWVTELVDRAAVGV